MQKIITETHTINDFIEKPDGLTKDSTCLRLGLLNGLMSGTRFKSDYKLRLAYGPSLDQEQMLQRTLLNLMLVVGANSCEKSNRKINRRQKTN